MKIDYPLKSQNARIFLEKVRLTLLPPKVIKTAIFLCFDCPMIIIFIILRLIPRITCTVEFSQKSIVEPLDGNFVYIPAGIGGV